MLKNEIIILFVSDSHTEYLNLEEIIAKESPNIDLIVHSGDFANIKHPEKDQPAVQQEGVEVFLTTISILKKAQKPIICVAGNVFFN